MKGIDRYQSLKNLQPQLMDWHTYALLILTEMKRALLWIVILQVVEIISL